MEAWIRQKCLSVRQGQGKSLFNSPSVSPSPLRVAILCLFSPSPPIPSPWLLMSHGIMATYTTGCFCRRKTFTVAVEKYSVYTFPRFACWDSSCCCFRFWSCFSNYVAWWKCPLCYYYRKNSPPDIWVETTIANRKAVKCSECFGMGTSIRFWHHFKWELNSCSI